MSGARPSSETAKRMGMVPYGSSNGRSNNGNVSGAGYPAVNGSVNKTGNTAQENGKTSNRGGNDQLWSNGSGLNQGSAPSWPTNDKGVPINPNNGLAVNQNNGVPTNQNNGVPTNQYNGVPTNQNNGIPNQYNGVPTNQNNGVPTNQSNGWQSKQAAATTPGPVGGGYIQGPQVVNGSGAPQQQQQQQQPNWQANNRQQQPNLQANDVQQGIPVSSPSGGYVQGPQRVNGSQQQQPNWEGPKGGYIAPPGPQKPMPKGDYVYYDGNGKQVQPGVLDQGPNGSQNGTGSGSDRHFHHHYFHNHVSQPAQQPVGYPYDKKMEEKKKRRPGAAALAALLVTCWACTCCCHAPCGF